MSIETDAADIMAAAHPGGNWPTADVMGRSPPATAERIVQAVLWDWMFAGIWVKRMLGHEPGADTHAPMLEDVALLVAKAQAYDRMHGEQPREGGGDGP